MSEAKEPTKTKAKAKPKAKPEETPKKKSLFDMQQSYRTVLEFDIESAEDAEAFNALIGEVEDDIEVKLVGYGHVVKAVDYEIGIIDAEVKRLSERKRVRAAKIQRLKEYMLEAMRETGKTKIEQPDRTVSIQKNPASMVLEAEATFPVDYYLPQDPKLDTIRMKRELKEGLKIEGAKLVQSEGIRIR